MRSLLSFSFAPRLVSCWMVTRSVSKHAPAYQRPATSRLLAHVPYGLMIPSESETAYETALQCTEIIDVRSPGEFLEDHMPGAINLPVLSNEERHVVGLKYKEDSFAAKKMGAALVARNIGQHLEGHFASKPGDYKPLVYCWRGGSRSNSMAVVLAQVGWCVSVLNKGYMRYRAEVRAALEVLPPQLHLVSLTGLTGTGKTALLLHLRSKGVQVLDLEGLANHRGSLLGAADLPPQPSQKLFESTLAAALKELDLSQPVWVEAESSKVGQIALPNAMWKAMKAAPKVLVTLPMAVRVKRILSEYRYWVANPSELKAKLGYLKNSYGAKTVDKWASLIDADKWPELVQCLLEDHYDASYAHGWADTRSPLATIELEGDSEDQMGAFIRAAVAISPKALRPEVAAKETGFASDLAR